MSQATRLGGLVLLSWVAAVALVHGQHLRRDGLVAELMLIDLDGDGIRLSSVVDGVRFTFASGRSPEQTAWTSRGPGDAFVVIDQNRDGRITSAEEILGGIFGPPNGFDSWLRRSRPRAGARSRVLLLTLRFPEATRVTYDWF